ncbi:hypothetical protein PR048_003717 [Dryococelus australis]|uniref:Uncharacterized protein n=1 Tax=Dryococelus australis TaxID=614101 RepID=A0ABQ9IPE6_9NEOP|nr:hypothetical protein PR048_003717 [Dryococelus australis]
MLVVLYSEIQIFSTLTHKFMVPGHTHYKCDYDHSAIERQKKKTPVEIAHPRDWYQLVRSTSHTNKFDVYEIKSGDFYDFGLILKQHCKFGGIQYKTLNEAEPFHILNLKRSGHPKPAVTFDKLYNGPCKITKERKKDLIDLLPLIDPMFHSFHEGLLTDEKLRNIDPDK